MKISTKLLAGAVLAVGLSLGGVNPSSASTIAIDSYLNSEGTYDLGGNSIAAKTSFSDYYTFDLSSGGKVTASAVVSETASTVSRYISNLSLNLQKLTSGVWQTVGYSTAETFGSESTKYYSTAVNYSSLNSGSYRLVVSGTTGTSPGKYTGSVSVSSVPLPGALPLFGGALMALGVLSRLRRSTAANAVA